METPLRRRTAAKQFVAAMKLVLETIDEAIDAESDGRSVQEVLIMQRVQGSAKLFHHGPGRKQQIVELAQKITDRLSPVDMVLLGTGACERQRQTLLQSLENRIANAPSKQAIEIQMAETLVASQRSYVNAPDWPDYLRAFATILRIIAEIWEWLE